MSEPGGQQRELVFCHRCKNEWLREQRALECPDCHSDVVEIIDERHDPRDNRITINDGDDDFNRAGTSTNPGGDRLPRHPLHDHNPWQAEPPDSAEPDIEHVEWNPARGVRFTRTSVRSATPGRGPRGQGDPFAPIFQSFSTMFEGSPNAPNAPDAPGRPRGFPHIPRPGSAPQNPLPDHHQHHIHYHPHDHWGPDGPSGGRHGFTATVGPFPANRTGNNIHAMLATFLQSVPIGIIEQGNGPQHAMNNFQAVISSLLSGDTHGDAVFTDEALDRIITQMMDQQNANSAPGPASAAAIAALPKRKIDKSMLGQDGKAECSVCMDVVELGDEVTVLPCKHWFHGDCVGAWLKEHDTCPHCRQGIMPKDAPENTDTPRSPDQEPRNHQNSIPVLHPSTATQAGQQLPLPGAFTQPGMPQPYVPGGFRQYPEPQNFIVPPGQQPEHSAHPPLSLTQQVQQHREAQRVHRRRSSARERSSGNGGEGSSSGQGVTGWIRNRLGGGNGSDR